MTLLMRRLNAAWHSFLTYDEQNQTPRTNSNYDLYPTRTARYALYEAMLNNTAYSAINTFAEILKSKHRLYKHIKGIRNPVRGLINTKANMVFGGRLDTETFQRGAIPIQTDNPAVLEALKILWEASRWQERKLEYVRTGVNLGDVALKVVDDPIRGKARLEILDPRKIRDVTFDDVMNVKRIVIQYERTEDDEVELVDGRLIERQNLKTFTYTEIITQDTVETFRNGYSFAFQTNVLGEPMARYENIFGFVPVVIVRHEELSGFKWGANAYHSSLIKIHENNDQATLLNDQIRKVIIPLLFATGIASADQIKKATASEKDNFTILYGPKESALNAIQSVIDINAVLAALQSSEKELEREQPTLAWKRIREEGGNHTAPGIRAVTTDAVQEVEADRATYEGGLIRAQKMAMTVMGVRKYPGGETFDENSFADGELDHQVKERPVIADTLSAKEKVDAMNQASAPLWLLLTELGFSDDIIEQVRSEEEAQKREDVRNALASIFPPDEGDSEQEDAQTDDNEAMMSEEEMRAQKEIA